MTEVDELFAVARRGDPHAFAEWAGRVERPARASLARFARAVDLEVVLQEMLLRMWLIAVRSQKVIEGENASLRMAIVVARNVAMEEVRRSRHGRHVPLDGGDTPELAVDPPPGPDPGLARAIRECIERLPDPLRAALRLRLGEGGIRPDRDLAESLGLKLNTFLQHIVRARRSMANCLKGKGIELKGVA